MNPRPFFADGIDLPLVAFYGLVVLVPLMLFQVAVEGGILSRTWGIAFRQLARPVFLANCWSLLAGIPTKIINAGLSGYLLPDDLAGYFARYPWAILVGTLLYFVVTILVEGVSLWRWFKRNGVMRRSKSFWLGIVLANTATYAVPAPIHYLGTKPSHDVRRFTSDTAWAKQPPTKIICIDPKTGFLKSIYSDGTTPTTLVPILVKDYVLTSDLDLILFYERDGTRCLYRAGAGVVGKGNAIDMKSLAAQSTFGPQDRQDWDGRDSFQDWNAWAVPGLGNHLRVYRTNDARGSLVHVSVNPGLLHLPDFRFEFSHPAFLNGRECLFQSGSAIYLLDMEQRRVGKVTNGRNFIILTPAHAKSP
jgi:hypothetical protein